MAVNAQFMRGLEEATYEDIGARLYQKQIARMIYPESRALIQAHLDKGHTVAVIYSATPYQVKYAAGDLGIEHILCTELEVKKGRFTGSVLSPTCFGQGKVDAAEALARDTGADLDASFFYSDSTDDLLLLERVGLPRVLNPSARLAGIASDRHWPSARFGSRGRATLSQWVRSIAATVSLVPTFAAGLPIYALTGSRRDSLNFSFSLFADTASALIGLHLNVTGEEHLWAQRPAVFIFNHQSKADVVIMASLLRRDMAGVGKQEIKKLPVIGKVLEMGGVVMIDRANAKNAIEAMTPLVTAMREEGKSVVLAPEGTRSISPKLLPFKKGAFHLAMQAGVPIVPVVIRNAGDVAPKGDFVFRPASVDVEVLPPIDTGDWRADQLNEHIRGVRNLFLKALLQPLEPEPKRARKAAAKSPGKKSTPTETPSKTAAGTAARKPAGPRQAAAARPKARPKAQPATATKVSAARNRKARPKNGSES